MKFLQDISSFQKNILILEGVLVGTIIFMIVASAGGVWSTSIPEQKELGEMSWGLTEANSAHVSLTYKSGTLKSNGDAISAFLGLGVIFQFVSLAALINIFPLRFRFPYISTYAHYLLSLCTVFAFFPFIIWSGGSMPEISNEKYGQKEVNLGYCAAIEFMCFFATAGSAAGLWLLSKRPEYHGEAQMPSLLGDEATDNNDNTDGLTDVEV